MTTHTDTERCQDCGRDYDVTWAAENDLWNEVMGSSAGMLCPDCFVRRCPDPPFFVAYREPVKP